MARALRGGQGNASIPVVAQRLDNGRTGFLDLPPEIRNVIYSYCLTRQEPLAPSRWHHWRVHARTEDDPVEVSLNVALLSTCHALKAEAVPVLYGANVFVLDHEDSADFLRLIGTNLKHVRQVKVDPPWMKHLSSCLNLLKQCQELDMVEFARTYLLWKKDKPQTLAAKIGPLARALHKTRKGTDKKAVFEVFQFEPIEQEPQTPWRRSIQEYNEAVEEIKATIKATLK